MDIKGTREVGDPHEIALSPSLGIFTRPQDDRIGE